MKKLLLLLTVLFSLSAYSVSISKDTLDKMKAHLAREYGADTKMYNYNLKRELNAYKDWLNIEANGMPEVAFDYFHKKLSREYPISFVMRNYNMKRQIKAYHELENFEKAEETPEAVYTQAREFAKNNNPKNYCLRIYTLKRGIESFHKISECPWDKLDLSKEEKLKIIERAYRRYPKDFARILYSVKRDIKKILKDSEPSSF